MPTHWMGSCREWEWLTKSIGVGIFDKMSVNGNLENTVEMRVLPQGVEVAKYRLTRTFVL